MLPVNEYGIALFTNNHHYVSHEYEDQEAREVLMAGQIKDLEIDLGIFNKDPLALE